MATSVLERLEARKQRLKLELEVRALEMRKSTLADRNRKRHYEGAARTPRTAGWQIPGMTGPVSTLAQALPVLRERSRDLIRNTGYGESAVSTIVSGMVGYGVSACISDSSRARARNIQALWDRWTETTQCDARQKSTLGGLQIQAVRQWVETGECLFRRVTRKNALPGEIPFAIQILEPELLDVSKEDKARGIRQGVECDPYGAPVAYWLYPEHPVESQGGMQSVRVSADDIGHMFFAHRAGQVRGVPLLAPVIMKMHDLGDYEDAQLTRQRLAACFMAFLTNMEAEEEDLWEEANTLLERLQPGIIQPLRTGESVQFANPPNTTGYTEYTRSILHSIAAGIGITYEDLTGDYSQVSWSSGRLARLKYYANLDSWQWQMFVPMFCDKVWRWFLDGAAFLGVDTSRVSVKYTLPRRPVADINEYKARRDEVRAGFKSIPEAIRENGYDPESVLMETAEFLKIAKEYGVVMDSDPSQVSAQGQSQPYPPGQMAGRDTGGEEQKSLF